ncbi:MAG: hypothetical protein GY768_12355 [Planctomycetaceae bacterium]|nr:hypothetical protein [Planctomycetaceae bacterium]
MIAGHKGIDWFVAYLNAVQARTLNIPLRFLSTDRKYEADIYRDAPSVTTSTRVGNHTSARQFPNPPRGQSRATWRTGNSNCRT